MEIALKVDVDTHQGLGTGMPRLQRLLQDCGVTASVFIAMGPDNSGRAIMRLFRNPGFLTKMRRTHALSMYGLRTALSGTLLPARPIARAFPGIIRNLLGAGFEVGIHGYDHVRWQDHLDTLGAAGVRRELAQACEVYHAISGVTPNSFAAPGWRTNDEAALALEDFQLAYRSDTRGRAPYRCRVGARILTTPEIPTTLPTLDEVMGTPELAAAGSFVSFYRERLRTEALNVHTIHAETEGMGQLEAFGELVRSLKAEGARFVRLGDVAATLKVDELPVLSIIRTALPGRAGWISAQPWPDA
jgi:peptidoglycan/xylan/chitin deacetylase (PgdA/CDA1 family)